MRHLGFFAAPMHDHGLSDVLARAREWGVTSLEIGCGGYPGTRHADAGRLVNDARQQRQFRDRLAAAGIEKTVLSCHCNPLHPDPGEATRADQTLTDTLYLAHELGIDTVVTFSGVGGQDGQLNWPAIGWPLDYSHYWQDVWYGQLVPYWQRKAQLAKTLGLRIAIELHGGFLVHSPGTLLLLREACGPALGANLDPSHFWWQGLDPLASVPLLGAAIHHVHIKDWRPNPEVQALWGMLDPRPPGSDGASAWEYAIPERGHGKAFWRPFIEQLEAVGFNGMLSIEHEDPTLSPVTGIKRTLDYIRSSTV